MRINMLRLILEHFKNAVGEISRVLDSQSSAIRNT